MSAYLNDVEEEIYMEVTEKLEEILEENEVNKYEAVRKTTV